MPGLPVLVKAPAGAAGPALVTVTPGYYDDGSAENYGFNTAGTNGQPAFGAISGQPMPGATCISVIRSQSYGGFSLSSSYLRFAGDKASLFSGFSGCEIDGVRFSVSTSLQGGNTLVQFASGTALPFDTSPYTIKLVA